MVLKPATTHFYKQIRGINLARFLIEIRATVWGLLGDPRNPTPPLPPVKKSDFGASLYRISFAGPEGFSKVSRRSSP